MKKCVTRIADAATYRAVVKVCPNCGAIMDEAEDLFRLLKELGMNGKVKRLLKEKVDQNKSEHFNTHVYATKIS